jgi:Predicted transcriptional regulators
MPQAKEEVGKFIRQVRLSRGLTQAQLALYTGIGQAEISRIENGERKPLRRNTSAKSARFCTSLRASSWCWPATSRKTNRKPSHHGNG